jgi:hypothetical protein
VFQAQYTALHSKHAFAFLVADDCNTRSLFFANAMLFFGIYSIDSRKKVVVHFKVNASNTVYRRL